ncbi:MAG: condensation domain-containing protein, partial [Verrucomicrobiota bacterium]
MPKIEDIYPLSPTQQGLLFHSLLVPGAGVYVPQITLTLSGTLDPKSLKEAWERAIQRHPILRTGFQWEQRDEPFQVVYRKVEISWFELDWSTLNPDEQAIKLTNLQTANRTEPFNLHRPPLMRLHLIRTGSTGYFLVWCYHHLILDGWSAGRVMEEVLQDYLSSTPDAGIPKPSFVPSRYADFIQWLNQQDGDAAQTFWERRLQSVSGSLYQEGRSGPTGHRERPTGWSETTLTFSRSETDAIKTLAKTNGITLNTLLLGALGFLLNRYRDSRQTIVGNTVAGRPASLPQADSMVGLFINTVPVVIPTEPGATVSDWLQRLHAHQAEANTFEHVSLRKIQTWTNGGNPLFDCLLVLENYPLSIGGGPSALHLENVAFDEWTHLPLTLLAVLSENLTIRAKFQMSHFEPDEAEKFLEHARILLAAFCRHPNAYLASINLLTESDSTRIRSWNQTDHAWPSPDATLCDLLTVPPEKAREAICFEEQSMTPEELQAHTELLAAELGALGVADEDLVAVYLDRSLLLPVALRAALWARAAFVPIDPSYPALRLQTILHDARPKVMIVDGRQKLPALETDAAILDLATIDWTRPGANNRPKEPAP